MPFGVLFGIVPFGTGAVPLGVTPFVPTPFLSVPFKPLLFGGGVVLFGVIPLVPFLSVPFKPLLFGTGVVPFGVILFPGGVVPGVIVPVPFGLVPFGLVRFVFEPGLLLSGRICAMALSMQNANINAVVINAIFFIIIDLFTYKLTKPMPREN